MGKRFSKSGNRGNDGSADHAGAEPPCPPHMDVSAALASAAKGAGEGALVRALEKDKEHRQLARHTAYSTDQVAALHASFIKLAQASKNPRVIQREQFIEALAAHGIAVPKAFSETSAAGAGGTNAASAGAGGGTIMVSVLYTCV